jgi:hypothetical protein
MRSWLQSKVKVIHCQTTITPCRSRSLLSEGSSPASSRNRSTSSSNRRSLASSLCLRLRGRLPSNTAAICKSSCSRRRRSLRGPSNCRMQSLTTRRSICATSSRTRGACSRHRVSRACHSQITNLCMRPYINTTSSRFRWRSRQFQPSSKYLRCPPTTTSSFSRSHPAQV